LTDSLTGIATFNEWTYPPLAILAKVIAHMKTMKINDFFIKNGYIRPDGRMIHEYYLMEVKKPSESKYPWDYYKVVERVRGEDAFNTKAESKCTLWK
jgi:branched-chain amino acid transport system substrate-binding protein